MAFAPPAESSALLDRISGPPLTFRQFALLAVACADQAGLDPRALESLFSTLHDAVAALEARYAHEEAEGLAEDRAERRREDSDGFDERGRRVR